MCRSTQDGTSVSDYNTDGTGYLVAGSAPTASASYISEMTINQHGLFPKSVSSGTQTTYYCDALWTNNSQTNFALFGGASVVGLRVGAFACLLSGLVSYSNWSIGVVLSGMCCIDKK